MAAVVTLQTGWEEVATIFCRRPKDIKSDVWVTQLRQLPEDAPLVAVASCPGSYTELFQMLIK